MPHAETIACVEKAKDLLKNADADSLRYASLQLCLAIEYLFYELVPLYREEVPADILKSWQPQKILDAILECDPDADHDAKFILAPAGKLDSPDIPKLVLESKAPNKRLLKKHYHRIASYLHAPTNLVEPDSASWKDDLEKAVAALETFKSDLSISNTRVLVKTKCVCGKDIKRNKQGVEATGIMQCHDPKCRAIIDVQFKGDTTHFKLREEWYDCPYCGTRNFYAVPTLKHGVLLRCVECERRVLVQDALRLEPIDKLNEIAQAAEAGHISEAQHLDFYVYMGNKIARKINAVVKPSPTDEAVHLLMGRLVQSGNTMRELFDHAKDHNWVWDGVSILRTSFDAMLQAMYILCDTAESDKLASRFLEFRIVERVKMLRIYDKGSTTLSRRLKASRHRADGEPEIMAEYDRVCRKYQLDPEERRHRDWYNSKLDKIATDTGYFAEYEIAQKQFSGVVHSSAFGLGNEVLTPFNVARIQWEFAFRVLGRYAAVLGVALDETEQKLVDEGTRNIYDNPELEPPDEN